MKRLVPLLAAGLLASVVPPAQAHHLPNQYCSESGDVCLSSKKMDGKRKLAIGTAAQYFKKYELCVTGPTGSTTCHTFEVTEGEGGYGDVVRWARNFPREGAGKYIVEWKFMNGDRIGKRLGFHV